METAPSVRPSLAIIHDYLIQHGGAERVVAALHGLFPDAPVYTSASRPDFFGPDNRADIRTSFMQHLPGITTHFRHYLPLYPLAFERFDLATYDTLLISSSAWAHGVRIRPGQRSIVYCHTPARWLWDTDRYLQRERFGQLGNLALKPVLAALRRWDTRAASQGHTYIANGTVTAARIKARYGMDVPIIHPPVDTARFALPGRAATPGDYLLIVARLIPYKRIDLAVRACTTLDIPLKVAGTGPDLAALMAIAGPTVEFLGRIPEANLPVLVAGCRAFVLPGEEDFGIAPVEAMAAGRPVIAYAAGGALETVVDGVTGMLFRDPTPESLADAVLRASAQAWDPAVISTHAAAFDTAAFNRKILAVING